MTLVKVSNNQLHIVSLNLAFDKQVQDSKKNATEALEKVSQIRQLIEEANDKTTRAQEALAGAEANAKKARDNAFEAKTAYAERAAEVNI